jgi:hypothetical protein
LAHRINRQLAIAGRGDRLVENRQRVPHRAVARFGKQSKGVFVGGLDAFATEVRSRSWPTMSSNPTARKAEVLATRANGLRNVFRLAWLPS